jgi:hypothetical protein
MFLHRDRRGTKPEARTPLRPRGYGETGPSRPLPRAAPGINGLNVADLPKNGNHQRDVTMPF